MTVDNHVLQPTFKIHAALADGGLWQSKNHRGQVPKYESIKLWYFLRSIDPAGSGWAQIELKTVAEFFDRSIYTIRRWLRWGRHIKAFRAVTKLGNGFYRVHYAALTKVAIAQGIFNLGAICYVKQDDLKTLKFAATEAEAMRLQNQTQFNESKKVGKERIPTPKQLVNSELGRGSILMRRGRFTFLKFNTPDYGTSQNRIAWHLGRHPSTVQRRLSNTYRQERSIKPVDKTQLATAPRRESSNGGKVQFIPGQRIIRLTEGVFRLGCNVYDSSVDMTSAKAERYRLKKAIAKSQDGDSWKFEPEYQLLMSAWRESVKNDKSSLFEVERRRPDG